MFYQKFQLSEKYPDACLTAYVCDMTLKSEARPAVIVFPGGGYHFLSEREAEVIVRFFFAKGFNAYLLEYSVGEKAAGCAPLIEAALAVKLVRERADLDNTNPEKIFTVGFSAGGHAAAAAGIYWNLPMVRDAVGVTDGSAPEGINRPNGMVLSYPVISAGEYAHKRSPRSYFGHDDLTDEEIEWFSLDKHVDKTTPPAFVWHTFADGLVPVQNSLMLCDALTKAGVAFELHIFPEGAHGMSLCTKEVGTPDAHNARWADMAAEWILL